MVNRKCPIFGHHIILYVPKNHSKGIMNYLRFMGSQKVRHDWATELNWTELMLCKMCFIYNHDKEVK